MAEYNIRFSNKVNKSLQVNDYVYAISAGADAVSATDLVGRVSEVRNANFIADTEELIQDANGVNPGEENYTETKQAITGANKVPGAGDFIMFRKDNRVNNCSLKGYYAEVMLTNTGTSKKELFSLGSEITESSK
tara:strand:+ start:104 stop:508 length:405 start_codon:yes stop_codon:yes gene_type:complete